MIHTQTVLTDIEVVAGALQWVNTMRSEHDLPALEQLPRGRHGDPGDCALARALVPTSDLALRGDGEELGATWRYAMSGKVVRVTAPMVVGEFIRRFDLGRLDHLLS